MAAPTVTSITPPTGVLTGGTVTKIAGTNFTGATSVTFGGTAATSFTVLSATSLYAIAPAHAVGTEDIVVTNPDGSGTGAGAYTFTLAASPSYNLYLWDDCCHIWISENTGGTFAQGCTPGGEDTPAPVDPGLDPNIATTNGAGTILDPWCDGQMAINDADYSTFVGVDQFYNDAFSIIAKSTQQGRNQTWTLIDPEPHSPAFVSNFDFFQEYFRAAISSGAETILVTTYAAESDPAEDFYPRISRDGGATWNDVTGVEPNVPWSAVCFGSTASEIMYLQPSSNVFDGGISPAYIRKSEDWGVTWAPLTNGPDTQNDSEEAELRLRCSADGETIIRIEHDGQFWISQDGGTSWANIDFPSVFTVTASNRFADCGISPDGQTIVVSFEQTLNAGFWPAVFISTDGGDNFTDISANLEYPASVGAPAGGAPGTNPTGCTQCNVAPDGLGVVVTLHYSDPGIVEPDGLTGLVMYANVSTDAGATFTLCSFDADPYENSSTLGLFTGIYITPLAIPAPSVDLERVTAEGVARALTPSVSDPSPDQVAPPCFLQDIIPSYLYQEYNDDDDLQAFVRAYNEYAQAFLDWFIELDLPIYTKAPVSGALLDWVAEGLYGMARPSLGGSDAMDLIGPYDTYAYNELGANEFVVGASISAAFVITDDVFRRILTWHFYKGDCKVFNIRWLKRRIVRFLLGTNGQDFNVDTTYQVSVTFGPGNQVNINFASSTSAFTGGALYNEFGYNELPEVNGFSSTVTPLPPVPNVALFRACVLAGFLELPFQFTYVINI